MIQRNLLLLLVIVALTSSPILFSQVLGYIVALDQVASEADIQSVTHINDLLFYRNQ